MNTSGIQVLAELKGCVSELLNDAKRLEVLVTAGLKKCGFHQVHISSEIFDPVGVTVIAIISESHISVHTYPEAQHASIDIFHCANDVSQLLQLLYFFKKEFSANSVEYIQVARGNNLKSIETKTLT